MTALHADVHVLLSFLGYVQSKSLRDCSLRNQLILFPLTQPWVFFGEKTKVLFSVFMRTGHC